MASGCCVSVQLLLSFPSAVCSPVRRAGQTVASRCCCRRRRCAVQGVFVVRLILVLCMNLIDIGDVCGVKISQYTLILILAKLL